MRYSLYFCLLAFILLATACQKNEFLVREDSNEIPDQLLTEQYPNLPLAPNIYQQILPKYLQALGMAPVPVDHAKATVGQLLFYDKNLSKDLKVACASCHKQQKAFSDDVAFSIGINGLKGTRNSMPIANVASFSAHYRPIGGTQSLLLWDNRASSVAQQAQMAFLNDHEMGMNMAEVVERVKEQGYYKVLWKAAYGEAPVEESRILDCLSEFVGAIGSNKSRFDGAMESVNGNINFDSMGIEVIIPAYYSGTNLGGDTTIVAITIPGFSLSEDRGRKIFVNNCTKCHSPIRPLQEVMEACNGLTLGYADQGKGKLTGNPADNGVFKSPSLRNIALTAPYMHDGRFKTLQEVIEFYSTGVKDHTNLHPKMRQNGKINLNLTSDEKTDLLNFLNTLTDYSILNDRKFADPFRQ